jgi:uncharacterized protein (TIGR00255 family)
MAAQRVVVPVPFLPSRSRMATSSVTTPADWRGPERVWKCSTAEGVPHEAIVVCVRDPNIPAGGGALLLSMTGHGEGHLQRSDLSVAVEVRTVNSRYFKLTLRAGECFLSLEPRIETVVRKSVRRGTVLVGLRIDRQLTPDQYRLNAAVIRAYRAQLNQLCDELHVGESVRLEALLGLPGVADERLGEGSCSEADWPVIEETLRQALTNLDEMRRDEGRAMGADLETNCQAVVEQLQQIAERAPLVSESYRARLTERLNKILAEHEIQVEPADVVREIGIFAERSDISEELVRLRSHIDQFRAITQLPESSGRKLDFLTQEMFREANTIGSKANDAEIAGHVVEVKAMIERMREMIQNIE